MKSFVIQDILNRGMIIRTHLFAYHLYGFTEEELDFIINYDIKYRSAQRTAQLSPARNNAHHGEHYRRSCYEE